jgi:sulfotransferase family protein
MASDPMELASKPTAQARGRRPDFMIIGAMKSGTTTLYHYLGRYSRIFMCYPKEPMFFSRQYSKGLDWYFSLFSGAGEDQICGEASTCYSRWPYFGNVAARIREAVPDSKFIYVMRHPVERAYSHYRHEAEERQSPGDSDFISFKRALEELPEIFQTGLYRLQIEKFLEYFPRDRLLPVFFEDLTRNPGPLLEEVQLFLGLEPEDRVLESEIVANAFGSRMVAREEQAFRDSVHRTPAVSAIVNRIPAGLRPWIRTGFKLPISIVNLATRRRVRNLKQQIEPLEDAMRRQLLERYAGANRKLEELMARPVPSSWHE